MLVKQAIDKAKIRIVKLILFSSIINVMTLAGSIYMLQVYDRVLPSRSFATLIGLSMLLIIVYGLQGYFDALRMRMLSRVGALFDQSLQKPIFDCITTMRLRGWDSATVTQPTRDLEVIRIFLSGMGPTAFMDLFWIPIFLIVLFIFHPIIGVGASIGMVMIVGITGFIEWRTKKHVIETTKLGMLRAAIARITAYNAEVIHALGMRGRFATQWRGINHAYVTESLRIRDIEADLGSIAKMLRYILQSSILGLGAALVITENATAGIMIASSIMMGRALAPIELVLGTWKQFKLAREALARLRDTLSVNATPPLPAVELPRPSSKLSVRDLFVMPPCSKQVVTADVSFDLTPGMGLALVGPSGSGKTSLVKTLVGIWQPTHGMITLDGAHIHQWDSDKLGKYVGYLPQDVALFDGTIAENIARFDTKATDADIMEAAKTAGVHQMITAFPDGYSRNIGEQGSFLSAGQRQRIALARAVYGNPFMVVLDEPNANLDSEGEMALTHTILRLREKKCIVIVVSHRPASLIALDTLMVLNNGKIVALGPRNAVLDKLRPKEQPKEPPADVQKTSSDSDTPRNNHVGEV
jgi:PrtD family type I secretion system ABC transporter